MKPGGALQIFWLGLWAALVGVGCETVAGIPLEELDGLADEPIALVYWDQESARRRLEIFDEMDGVQRGRARVGFASLGDMASLVNRDDRSDLQRKLARFPGRIALLNPRSLEITPFPAAPPNARPLAWSPDRTRLLFASYHQDGQTSQLFEYDKLSGEVRKLTQGPAHHIEADYAPDGRLVVSWVDSNAGKLKTGVDLIPASGGLGSVLVDGAYGSGVRWSPKGDAVVYVHADNRVGRSPSRRDGSSIVIQPAEPTAKVDLLARGREPVFTPDGEWIVFSSLTSNGWQLQRMRPDGSARRFLGKTPRDERQPAVSPDGRFVVYVSVDDEGHQRLFLRRFDGSGDRRLLAEGAAEYPVW